MKTKNDTQIENDLVSMVNTFADYTVMLKRPTSNIFFLHSGLQYTKRYFVVFTTLQFL